jgi:two-component system sensor histidine kinase PilS (NtrC family)
VTKVKGLIFFRVFFTIILLGSYILFKIGPYPFPYYHLIKYLVYSVFILSIVYLLLLKYIKNLRRFAYIQLIIDSILIIFLIFMTGGVESWFSFLMVLNVIAGAIVVGRPAGYVIATVLGILYGTLMDLQFYRIIPIGYESSLKVTHFLYNIFIHISALYLVAYLSGHLTSRLEKTYKSLEKTQHDLVELKALNTMIVENVPSGIVTTDISWKIIAFNSPAEQITGMSRDEVIGKGLVEVFPFLDQQTLTATLPFRTEGIIKARTDSGLKERIIGITLNNFKAEGSSGVIGVFQDLTEIKKREEEAKRKEKLAAIGELSRNIAHEIRNPLASLKGSIEILLEDRVPEEHKKRLMEIAIKEMDRLNKIITDFLLYTRPVPLNIKSFNLMGLLDEVILMLRTSHGAENIEIKKQGPQSLEIAADESQLKQVFLNLGYNALEAMPDGGRLEISVRHDNRNVVVLFSDTGPGISEEDIDKIFYPFYSTKETGSGLGLAIAYKIIEEHHGKISVKSFDKTDRHGQGSGATFEVVLPLKQGNRY